MSAPGQLRRLAEFLRLRAFEAVSELRAAGLAADTDHAGRSLKGQLTYAQKHARATVVVSADGWTLRRPGELDVAVEPGRLKELL